jgi:uncharacterized small protein (DUF1192 family)
MSVRLTKEDIATTKKTLKELKAVVEGLTEKKGLSTKAARELNATIALLEDLVGRVPAKKAASTEEGAPVKVTRNSPYNDFMKVEIARIKAEEQGIEHKVAFKQAAANWKKTKVAKEEVEEVEEVVEE